MRSGEAAVFCCRGAHWFALTAMSAFENVLFYLIILSNLWVTDAIPYGSAGGVGGLPPLRSSPWPRDVTPDGRRRGIKCALSQLFSM